MLQNISDRIKGHRWLAWLLLGALILVFAAWGAYGIVEFNFGGAGTYAAEVDGEPIPLEDARQAWSQQQAQFSQQFGGELPEPFRKQLQEALLEGLIRNVALGQHAIELGYRVSDAQVEHAVRGIPAFQVEGRYSPDAAKGALAQAGVSLAEFETDFRRDLLRRQLIRGIEASDFATPQELERLHALEDEQREVRYILLPAERFGSSVPVDDAAAEDYLKKNQAQYMTPESVRLAYGELRVDQVAAQLPVTEEDVRQVYEKDKARYVQPERRRSHHILVANGPDAEKTSQDVLAQVRKPGADFAALARKYSADPGSASQGGDLGWSERDAFAAAFGDALFAMQPGEIRGPVKTEYGYHIIRLDEIQAGRTQPFEDARAEIEARLRTDRATDHLGDIQQQIERKIEESSADFDALVKEFGLHAGEVAEFTRDGGGAPLGSAPELQELVFSPPVLEEKRTGGPIAVGEDRIVIVKVREHRKAAPQPLAAVRDQVVAAIRRERGTAAAAKAADAARTQLLSGKSLDEVAKGFAVTADPARFVGRQDPSIPAPIRAAAFQAPKPVGKPVIRTVQLEDGGSAVFAITAARLDPAGIGNERQLARRVQAAARNGAADAGAYLADLRRTVKVSKNPQAFE